MALAPRWAAGIAVLALVLLSPSAALGQACCTATGSSEFGVVGRCHFAVLALALGHDRAYGTYDRRGDYHALKRAEVDDLVLSLGGGIRVTRLWQIHGSVPLRWQYRSFGDGRSGARLGPGDAGLGTRYMLFEDPMAGIDASDPGSWVPFFEPFVGVRAPTGRAPSESREATMADVTGEGAWAVYAGVSVAKFLTNRHVLQLSGTYGHRFEHDVAAPGGRVDRFAPGDEWDAALGYLQIVDMFWSWGVFSSLRSTASVRQNGALVDDSATHRVRFGARVSRYLEYPTWQLAVSAAFDPPASGFGENVPFAGTNVTLTLQRNFTY